MTREPAYAALGFVLAVSAACGLSVNPPKPPRDAPAVGFALDRARASVARLAARPRPPGSPEHDAAEAYLVGELEALGLAPEVQRVSIRIGPEDAPPLPLANVLVRVPGTAGEGAVLVQAHYDSRDDTPGAGDNAAAVAALLEALRALLPGAPYRNDLIFHFDDGEELGLLGAQLFLEEHPWSADVRCVLNFDARGDAGTPLCFEVGRGSGPLVAAFARSHPRPVGASLAAAVYARMRNDTSFSPFRDAGLPGLNFAFVGGASAYHRPWDTPENLSGRTLQRAGEYALAATRAAADLDLLRLGADDRVFFNAGSGGLVTYPLRASLPLTALALLLLLLYLWRALQGGVRLLAGLARAAVLGAAVLAWGLGAGWLAQSAGRLAAGFMGEPRGNLLSTTLVGFGVGACGLAAGLAVLGRRPEPAALDASTAGGLALVGLLLALAQRALPAGAYVLAWPLLLILPGAFALLGRARASLAGGALALLGCAAASSLLGPTCALLVQVGSIHPPRAALIAAALTALLVVLFQPALRVCLPRQGRGTATAAGALGALLLLAGAVAAGRGM
jgi:hypothetical protein